MASSITSAQPPVVATPAAPPAAPAAPPSPQAKRDAQPAAPQRVEGKELDVEGLRKAAIAVAMGKAPPPVDGETPETPAAPAAEAKPTPPKPKEPGKEGEEEELPPPPADLTQKKLSEGFAKLERQRRRDQKEFNERTAALAAREAEVTQLRAEAEAKAKAAAEHTNDPLRLLESHGWDVDRFVKFVMSDGQVPPEVLAQKATEATKKQLEEQQKKLDAIERQRQQHEDALLSSEWERRSYAGVEAKLGKIGEPLEHGLPHVAAIDEWSGRGTVFSDVLTVQAQHFQRTGQTLDPATALVHVEQAYAARFPNLLKRNPAQQGAGTPATTGAEKPRQITSSDVSDVSVPTDEELDKMTPDERRARAVRIAKGSR